MAFDQSVSVESAFVFDLAGFAGEAAAVAAAEEIGTKDSGSDSFEVVAVSMAAVVVVAVAGKVAAAFDLLADAEAAE